MASYLLDTNILVKLANPEDGQHAVCKQALQRLKSQGHQLCIAPQVLVEFWVVCTRPADQKGYEKGYGWNPSDTRNQINKLRNLFELRPEVPELFDRWLDMVSKANVRGKRAHDARLAAFVVVHHIDYLLSFNIQDFQNLQVKLVHPQNLVLPCRE